MTPIEQAGLPWILNGSVMDERSAETVRSVVLPVLAERMTVTKAARASVSVKKDDGHTMVSLNATETSSGMQTNVMITLFGDQDALAVHGLSASTDELEERRNVATFLHGVLSKLMDSPRMDDAPRGHAGGAIPWSRIAVSAIRGCETVDAAPKPGGRTMWHPATPLGTGGSRCQATIRSRNGDGDCVVVSPYGPWAAGAIDVLVLDAGSARIGNRTIKVRIDALPQEEECVDLDPLLRMRLESEIALGDHDATRRGMIR